MAEMKNDQIKSANKKLQSNKLLISAVAFTSGGFIPSKYTCDGTNINPELSIENIPDNAQSLALIVDDPDAPMGTWVHWVVWNIPIRNKISENDNSGISGINDFHQNSYGGPCPPSGIHRYYFRIYALDTLLKLPVSTDKTGLEKAMSGHILSAGEIMGKYKRA
jgi:hypothetical protein